MLNRIRLLAEVERVADDLFPQQPPVYGMARAAWRRLIQDQSFLSQIRAGAIECSLADWIGPLDQPTPVGTLCDAYCAVAVDGSQIYPDRHQGVGCFLINLGVVQLQYGPDGHALFDSVPHVFGGDYRIHDALDVVPETVNALRCEYEMQTGLERVREQMEKAGGIKNTMLLFDGALIFWNLESSDGARKQIFLPRYLQVLDELYRDRIPAVWYISMPKSRELASVVRAYLQERGGVSVSDHAALEAVVDTSFLHDWLDVGQRTAVCKSRAFRSCTYPPHLHPHFFYLHVGSEVGRVELPAWMAQDEAMVDYVAQVILDQCQKGRGYPVAIAESHEQAVVRGADRDFFYQVIVKGAFDRGRSVRVSQKAARKLSMGI